MKKFTRKSVSTTIICFCVMAINSFGQGTTQVSQELLDMKLELLNSQIDLFNAQLQVWETKPRELERRLSEVDQRINQLAFDPVYINARLQELEILVEDLNTIEKKERRNRFRPFRPDSIITVPYKTAIALNPIRLMEGTFHVTYERAISSKLGLGISGLATFATEEGVSAFYVRNQQLDYYNAALSSTMPYTNNNISGYGIGLTMKNYLLTDIYKKQRSPVGLYAAPNILFRRLWLSGMSQYYLEDEWIEEEVTRLLNIFAMGVQVGWKFTLVKVLYIDVYAGGQIRLAKYDDEDKFTKYKSLGNIDFSGVMPTVGLSIGILK